MCLCVYGQQNHSLIFCLCDQQFPFYTIVVFDEFQNAIPVCFAVLQNYKVKQVSQVLTAVKEAAQHKREEMAQPGTWKPNCWIIDVADEEAKAIR